jgi:hypothetical protein
MLNPEALLSYVPLLHRPVPTAAELRGITIKNKLYIFDIASKILCKFNDSRINGQVVEWWYIKKELPAHYF